MRKKCETTFIRIIIYCCCNTQRRDKYFFIFIVVNNIFTLLTSCLLVSSSSYFYSFAKWCLQLPLSFFHYGEAVKIISIYLIFVRALSKPQCSLSNMLVCFVLDLGYKKTINACEDRECHGLG